MESMPENNLAGPERSPLSKNAVSVIFWKMITACTVLPWILHAFVGWWAGLLSIPLLFYAYDYLFVSKGSLCMGIWFTIPLSSALCLLFLNLLHFVKWVFHVIANT
jgi:hypothetical protein